MPRKRSPISTAPTTSGKGPRDHQDRSILRGRYAFAAGPDQFGQPDAGPRRRKGRGGDRRFRNPNTLDPRTPGSQTRARTWTSERGGETQGQGRRKVAHVQRPL